MTNTAWIAPKTGNTRLEKYSDWFKKTFNTELRNFWDGELLGLNVVKFDRWLKTPDGVSTIDWIKTKYDMDDIRHFEAKQLLKYLL